MSIGVVILFSNLKNGHPLEHPITGKTVL